MQTRSPSLPTIPSEASKTRNGSDGCFVHRNSGDILPIEMVRMSLYKGSEIHHQKQTSRLKSLPAALA